MAKITWLGEDDLHRSVNAQGETLSTAGPSFTTWGGVKFPKGESVEVTDAYRIKKAKNNPFFKVDGAPGRPKAGDD